jgi:hypothetical protein
MLDVLAAFGLGAGLVGGALWWVMEPYSDPVEDLRQLEDSPDRVYVWEVPDDDARRAWLRTLEDVDQEQALQATHFVLGEESDLNEYSRDELRAKV